MFKYIQEALEILFSKEGEHCSIVKDIYYTVAKQNHTTVVCVESALRKGLCKLCKSPNKELKKMLDSVSIVEGDTISNSKFLHLLFNVIKHEIAF